MRRDDRGVPLHGCVASEPCRCLAAHDRALGLLGRIDEANEALAHTLTMQPDLSSAHVVNDTVFADPADRARFLEGLRKAGLKD